MKLKACFAFLLLAFAACGRPAFRTEELLVWVPGGGAREARIRELVGELGIPATFIGDRDVVSVSPRDLGAVRTVVCFDGPGGRALSSTAIMGLLRRPSNLVLVGEGAGILGPGLGFRLVPSNETGLRWEAPVRARLVPGSYDPSTGQAQVYGYGDKQVPGWRFEGDTGTAWARDQFGRARWMERGLPHGGTLVAVALPLAQLAVDGDGGPARMLLERAAELTGSPRLWPTPRGKGALVFNLHVDGQSNLRYLPQVLREWPQGVKGTVHVTAGPDCDREGDRQGFGALDPARGAPWLPRLRALGELGPHGGWTHNLWSESAQGWPRAKREEMLRLNVEALAANGPLRSYSSPSGLTPRDVYPWLEARGFTAYYTTGEGGGPPTRAWQDGSPCSQVMWAFPSASMGAYAATYEFNRAGISQDRVAQWLEAMLTFCETARTGRLVYGHGVDLADMPQAYFGFLRGLASRAGEGRLLSMTMGDYAAFLERRSRSRWQVQLQGANARLSAQGASLKDQCFRLPGVWRLAATAGLTVERAAGDTWITVDDERTDLEVSLWR